MATFYDMPSISPTMEVGTLVAWRLAEGESFTPQTVLAEVGTDKANMEAEVFDDGVLIKHLIAEGDEVPPGFPMAIVGASKDEDISALLKEFEVRKAALAAGKGAPKAAPAAGAEEEAPAEAAAEAAPVEAAEAEAPAEGADEAPPEAAKAAPEAAPEAAKAAPEAAKAAPEAAKAAPKAAPVATAPKPAPAAPAPKAAPAAPAAPAAAAPKPAPRSWAGKALSTLFLEPPGDLRAVGVGAPRAGASGARVAATPLARAIAADRGVDLGKVQGTGPGGRIVKADVENAPAAGASGKAPAAPPPADATIRNSPMRKTVAKRLLQSHLEIPSFFLTVVLDTTRMVQLREALKEALPDAKISYNDILIACVGRALREYPKANASWDDKAITRHGRVDVGMAVALEDGLITPVIRDADTKDLATIASETRDLAERARKGKLGEAEYQGSTFTVSNLGMMGIDEFTAIINPPETGILAVGAMQDVPVVQGGQVTVGSRMKVTMTCDHRVIDGYVGAQFLQILRKYAENPFRLLL